MGWINLFVDLSCLALWVRAIVPNEGHMAFNRPYQWIVQHLEPVWLKLRVPEKKIPQISLLCILVLIGFRGLVWGLCGTNTLDFKVTSPVAHGFLQSQLLSPIAAVVFFLQTYAFITLAIAIGGLESRTDHYSRLFRAVLGPLKKVSPWMCCLFPALALVLFWSVASWVMMVLGLIPSHRLGITGCVLGAIPVALALIVSLAGIWIALLIVRILFFIIAVWKPPVLDVIERVTDPVMKPFQGLNLKTGRFDLAPTVAIIVLAVAQWGLIDLLQRLYEKL